MLTEIKAPVDCSPQNNDPSLRLTPISNWQTQLKEAFRQPDELLRYLQIDAKEWAGPLKLPLGFPMRVPLSFAQRMRPGDLQDPLLKQVLPTHQEQAEQPAGFSTDPLQETAHNPVPGLIHKYQSRVLVLSTQACAVHCRYCFRQHFPYQENRLDEAHWQQILAYLTQDASIKEVILSGGDPLSLSNNRLTEMLNDLANIPHLEVIRFHTRLPIVLPARLDSGLLQLITNSRFNIVMVVHSNHPQELNDEVAFALAALKHSGITLLNQAVLLAGINDQLTTQCGLSWRLFNLGVIPYYLHLLDPVTGAYHFQCHEKQALRLWQSMQATLPGYLLPRLVKEVANQPSKTWLL